RRRVDAPRLAVEILRDVGALVDEVILDPDEPPLQAGVAIVGRGRQLRVDSGLERRHQHEQRRSDDRPPQTVHLKADITPVLALTVRLKADTTPVLARAVRLKADTTLVLALTVHLKADTTPVLARAVRLKADTTLVLALTVRLKADTTLVLALTVR